MGSLSSLAQLRADPAPSCRCGLLDRPQGLVRRAVDVAHREARHVHVAAGLPLFERDGKARPRGAYFARGVDDHSVSLDLALLLLILIFRPVAVIVHTEV